MRTFEEPEDPSEARAGLPEPCERCASQGGYWVSETREIKRSDGRVMRYEFSARCSCARGQALKRKQN